MKIYWWAPIDEQSEWQEYTMKIPKKNVLSRIDLHNSMMEPGLSPKQCLTRMIEMIDILEEESKKKL